MQHGIIRLKKVPHVEEGSQNEKVNLTTIETFRLCSLVRLLGESSTIAKQMGFWTENLKAVFKGLF